MAEVSEEHQAESAPPQSPRGEPTKRLRFVRWSYRWVWVVVGVGVLVTAGLGLISAELASSNEHHLLKLRSKEVGSVLTSALPDVQTPLGAAVALADITRGGGAKFSEFAETYVGTGLPFTSMSVWRVGHLSQGPVVVVGTQPELSQARGGAVPILRAAASSGVQIRRLSRPQTTLEDRFSKIIQG